MDEELTARLDRQAEAIRGLLRRVKALEEAGATPSTDAGLTLPATCLVCGGNKNGRADRMTCADCGHARAEALKPGGDRASITTTECALCHAPKPATTRIVCAPCGARLR